MVPVEHKHHIRYEFFTKGTSIRQIARSTEHDRETVNKIIAQRDFSPTAPVKRTRRSKTDAYREQVRTWLEEDRTAPRKQYHTAHRVYCRLRDMERKANRELLICERTVRNLVSRLKQEMGQQQNAYLPLLHPCGEAQVDFGETTFYENGVQYRGCHLALTLPHSDAKYVQLFKGQNFDCLAQGLADIFRHLGAVPTVIRFDNMSTAVKAIKSQGEREVTEGFRRLQCHYGFSSNFCNPNAGHEKGSVENYVGYSRRNYFVPVPELQDLREYNRELLLRCDADLDREHYKLERAIQDLLAEDKAVMNALPECDYEACRYHIVRTDAYGMARFQCNRYSTSGCHAKRNVTLKVGAHQVVVLDDGMRPVVTHQRLYGKNKEAMVWGPYLDVLAQRPTALKYSGFFEELPEPVRRFFDTCDRAGKKQVLRAVAQSSREHGMDRSVAALSQAVGMSPRDADDLVSAYAFVLHGPGRIEKNPVPDRLPALPCRDTDFTAYAQLMGGVTCTSR